MLSYPDFIEKQIVWIDSWEIKNLSIQNSNLTVKEDAKIINQIALSKIFAVFLVGNGTFSSSLFQQLIENGAILLLLNLNFKPYCLIWGETEGNTLLREKQYLATDNLQKAQWIAQNKITNQLALLKAKRKKTTEMKIALKKMEEFLLQIQKTQNAQEILGFEGNASKLFFSNYFGEFRWRGRKPRTKYDELNTLLDIGYTLIFNFVEAHLRLYGFDIYKGFYHTEFYQRKSLVCDLVEPFRCVVDYALYRILSLKTFDVKDFEIRKGEYHLKQGCGKKYIKVFLEGIMWNKSEIFLFLQTYYRQTVKGGDDLPLFLIKKSNVGD